MHYLLLSDDEIISGFREGDADIIREYFYGYCQVGYNVFDQHYQLRQKENLDFMSLAHQYAIYLMEHDWRPLEDHSPGVSLKTWLIGGFRYVVLDALKWYRREYGSITFEDYLRTFDVSDDLRLQFNRMVEDVCAHAPLDRQERLIIDMLLLQGFKSKEVAAQLGMTPSAISQKYKKLKEQVIVPYFKKNFDMDLDMTEVIDEPATTRSVCSDYSRPALSMTESVDFNQIDLDFIEKEIKRPQIITTPELKKRTTPAWIASLHPGEIFVFGSNLKGMHGGGAAYMAHRRFGAVMGQGVGLQGQSYAIPTMQGGVETIRPYADEFIAFAREHREFTFLVTRIGCGMAGFTDAQMAPLFAAAHAAGNIVLPAGW